MIGMRYLFRSRALQLSLSFLAMHTEDEYPVEDVAEAAGVSVIAARQALGYLERDDLVSHRAVGRRWLYRVNVHHPYFPDLRSIAVKSLGGHDEIARAIYDDDRILFSAVFGSFARGTERVGSDVDVLFVVADEGADDTDFRIASKMAGVSARIARQVNPSIYPISEFRRLQDAKDESLSSILAGKLLVLKGEQPR
jgi:predicted nucleotidyltransferase